MGNIGVKSFCRVGIRCNQCEEKKNTCVPPSLSVDSRRWVDDLLRNDSRECNMTFPAECKGECEAYSPIPF